MHSQVMGEWADMQLCVISGCVEQMLEPMNINLSVSQHHNHNPCSPSILWEGWGMEEVSSVYLGREEEER